METRSTELYLRWITGITDEQLTSLKNGVGFSDIEDLGMLDYDDFKRKINDTYLDRPPNMQDAYCSKSLVFLSTATPLTSRKKQVWMSTVLAKNLTRDHHFIVSFLQKQWTIQEPKLHLLHQSFNAANREPVSLGLKIELKGNS